MERTIRVERREINRSTTDVYANSRFYLNSDLFRSFKRFNERVLLAPVKLIINA